MEPPGHPGAPGRDGMDGTNGQKEDKGERETGVVGRDHQNYLVLSVEETGSPFPSSHS